MQVWVDGLTGTAERVPEVRRRAAEMDLHAYLEHSGEPEADVITLQPRAVDRLGEIRVPTLVIVGDLDTPSTVSSCRQISLGVPGARLVVMSGVAHLPPMERPGEFAALVREFVATSGA
jgi:pimeloyl-ACP methyl ester carboxylesterase